MCVYVFLCVRILKGADPGELPVERPNKFDLIVNLAAAEAIGVTVPVSLLLRANRVIDWCRDNLRPGRLCLSKSDNKD